MATQVEVFTGRDSLKSTPIDKHRGNSIYNKLRTRYVDKSTPHLKFPFEPMSKKSKGSKD